MQEQMILELIRERALRTLFQPIVDGATRTALEAFHGSRLEGRLFLNLLPQTLLQWSSLADWLGSQLDAHRVEPHDLVLEITEHGLSQDEKRLAAAARPLRALGCGIVAEGIENREQCALVLELESIICRVISSVVPAAHRGSSRRRSSVSKR